MNKLEKFLEQINHNLWAGIALLIGGVLVICKHEEAGKMAIAGGLAVLKTDGPKC